MVQAYKIALPCLYCVNYKILINNRNGSLEKSVYSAYERDNIEKVILGRLNLERLDVH